MAHPLPVLANRPQGLSNANSAVAFAAESLNNAARRRWPSPSESFSRLSALKIRLSSVESVQTQRSIFILYKCGAAALQTALIPSPSFALQPSTLAFSRNFLSSTLVPISKNRPSAGQEAFSHVRP